MSLSPIRNSSSRRRREMSSSLSPPTNGVSPTREDETPVEHDNELSTRRVLFLGASLLGVGTLAFYLVPGMIVERDVDDNGDSADGQYPLVDAFYCSAITLTTVGYGDICPGEMNAFGKAFLIAFSLGGLGFFCGPMMELAASWRHYVPGGMPSLLLCTVYAGVFIFRYLEGMPHYSEAVYASIITGTTIGYGDFSPKSNVGKIAIALYAIVVVNVVAALLEPAKSYLEAFCRVRSSGGNKFKLP